MANLEKHKIFRINLLQSHFQKNIYHIFHSLDTNEKALILINKDMG